MSAPVRITGTRIVWSGVMGWLEAVACLQARWHQAAPYLNAARALYRSLTPEHISECRDVAALEVLERLLRRSRSRASGLRHCLGQELDRPELGALLVHTRNHLAWVKAGCPDRTKGPRLDPRLLPVDRLEALIQRHPDLALVERLRQERARRSRPVQLSLEFAA